MIRVFLISGFLGAGKTTLIKHLLTSQFNRGKKIAILVNEVGKIGVDGAILSGLNVDVVELTSGCICCSIKTDFFKAVQEIYQRFGPDFLIVEPTGVAQPGEILDVLGQPPLSEFCRVQNVVTVVDASFFKAKELLGPFYDQQIGGADILLLNKIDLVKEGLAQEVKSLLRKMNPWARILLTQNCTIEPAILFEGSSAATGRTIQPSFNSENLDQVGFQTFSFEDNCPMDKERFVCFLESLPPTLFRVKGWVRFPDSSAMLDFSGGRYRIEPIRSFRNTALALVGRKCPQDEILKALKECMIHEPM